MNLPPPRLDHAQIPFRATPASIIPAPFNPVARPLEEGAEPELR
jgi:hypothetical protein